jgi:hypothetical protein
MSKKIKITETELKKLIKEIINEQTQFGGGTTGGAGAGGSWGNSTKPTLPVIDFNKLPQRLGFSDIDEKKLIAAGFPSYNKDNLRTNINTSRYYPSFAEGEQQVKIKASKPPVPNYILNPKDPIEKQIKSSSSSKQQIIFKPNEKFPLKFLQKGENIRLIQYQLGMPKNLQTGNFYYNTEKYLKKVVPEYNTKTGITQEIFNKIFNIRDKSNYKPETTIKS